MTQPPLAATAHTPVVAFAQKDFDGQNRADLSRITDELGWCFDQDESDDRKLFFDGPEAWALWRRSDVRIQAGINATGSGASKR